MRKLQIIHSKLLKLSVIIVNYNVKYFLEQCLHSVRKACVNISPPDCCGDDGSGLSSEIIVIDNNSVDGSVKMVKEKFADVHLIANKENVGFAKANNQGIKIANGEYVLLLNPDTIVEEDTFSKIIKFMDEHPTAGALGVKMLNGKGKFLPESKRSLPTPEVAFYKIFGLSKLFPHSKRFGKYHLTYLDKDKIHTVDVLAGAFMLVRKKILDEIGLLDETFFMYGEDIDLSYRITQAGYKNYYFPETRIIHYKGESTKKTSINYVFMFYRAMVLFAKKHFSKERARLFSLLINIAIYLRAFISILYRVTKKIYLPTIDATALFAGLFFIKNYWEANVIYPKGGHYPLIFIYGVIPSYILIWLLTVFFSGGYDKPFRIIKLFRGIFFGTIIILVIYALLPESFRFSRAIILIGAVWTLLSILAIRLLIHLVKYKDFNIDSEKYNRLVIVGKKDEAERISALLNLSGRNLSFVSFVSPDDNSDILYHEDANYVGNLKQLNDIIDIYKIDEVIFCAKDLSAQKTISQMSTLAQPNLIYKIAPPESFSIIGSNSIMVSGDEEFFPYHQSIGINFITQPKNIRNKRLFDIAISLFFIIFIPIIIFLVKKPFGLITNILSVLIGKKSWVGYYVEKDYSSFQKGDRGIETSLPKIRKGVLNPIDGLKNKTINEQIINNLNLIYAKDYKIENDIFILMKGIRNLGRR